MTEEQISEAFAAHVRTVAEMGGSEREADTNKITAFALEVMPELIERAKAKGLDGAHLSTSLIAVAGVGVASALVGKKCTCGLPLHDQQIVTYTQIMAAEVAGFAQEFFLAADRPEGPAGVHSSTAKH